MGKADAGLEQGGGICQDLRPDILGGGSFGNVVRVRDVVDDAAYQGGVLGGFHHRVAHSLTGRQPWRERYRVWI